MLSKIATGSCVFMTLLAVCSCSKTNLLPEQRNYADGPVPVMLSGRMGHETDELDSKTSIGSPVVPMVWCRGDQVGLFLSEGASVVSASNNTPVMVDPYHGPGAMKGLFSGELYGLKASTTYSVLVYYPWYQSELSQADAIYGRIHPHQVQSQIGSSAHIGRSGGFATAESFFTTPSSLDGYTAEFEFTLEKHHTSYVQFDISAAEGNYSGWTLKRIEMCAPEDTYIAGQTQWKHSSKEFSLVDSDALSNSVILDIESSQPLSTAVQSAWMVVFPVSIKGKDITFSYTLQSPDGSQTEVLTRTRTMSASSTLFSPGKIYKLSEIIPATAGGNWTATAEIVDIEWYRSQILDIAKRASVPSINVTFKDNTREISMFVVNEDFYDEPGRAQEKNALSENSIYVCASTSKVMFNYIFWKMYEEGYFHDLDQPVYELWPGMLDLFTEKRKEMAKQITFRMLLLHTSGLEKGLTNGTTYWYYTPFNFDHYSSGYYPGGNKYLYSNKGISILGWTMEYLKGYAMGEGLHQIAREYIFDKLGMTNTDFEWLPSHDLLAVNGYRAGSYVPYNQKKADKANSAYSLRSNSKEYSKYLQWMMRGADLSPETLEMMFRPILRVSEAHPGSTTEDWRTMGWMVERCEELGPVYRHGGSLPGYRAEVCMIPERNATIAIFVNIDLEYEVREAVFNLFLPHKDRFSWISLPPVPDYKTGNAGITTIDDEW